MNSRVELFGVIGVLLIAGILAWDLSLQPAHETFAGSLDRIPRNLMGWVSRDIAVDPEVSDLLRADFNVQRIYVHPQGYAVFVYVGYYGTEGGGAPNHTPEVCYPSQGWEIERDDEFFVGDDENGFRVREFLVEREDSLRLVHFWYRTETDSGFTSTLTLRLRHFWSRVVENRGDGALVRVSTLISSGEDETGVARQRLLGFDRAIEAALNDHWPQPTEARDAESERTVGPESAAR